MAEKSGPAGARRARGTSVRRLVAMVVAAATLTGCGFFFDIGPSGRNFRESGLAASEFRAIQIDPSPEDSAGPQILIDADFNGDGLVDFASSWNESQPIQVHIQRRSDRGVISFETVAIAGITPIARVADLAAADFDSDGRMDLAVLVKDTGFLATCRATGELLEDGDGAQGTLIIYFGPDDPADIVDPLAWEEIQPIQTMVAGLFAEGEELPEIGSYTNMVVDFLDGDPGPDIVLAWNAAECEGIGNRIDLYSNPGLSNARNPNAWVPEEIEFDLPEVKDIEVFDVDRDGDLDVVATYPTAIGANVRWRRNPLVDIPDDFHASDGTWQRGGIATVATNADVIDVGDIDRDGIMDIVVRSTSGLVVNWLKGPRFPTSEPVRDLPWQTFALAEFISRAPEAIALGDIDGDGQLDLVASAQGAIAWFEAGTGSRVYNQWEEHLIIDDNPEEAGQAITQPQQNPIDPGATDPGVMLMDEDVETTLINNILIVDVDGDGNMDIVATIDRNSLSGLTNDAIIWFENLR
jgi:hypothetical protein